MSSVGAEDRNERPENEQARRRPRGPSEVKSDRVDEKQYSPECRENLVYQVEDRAVGFRRKGSPRIFGGPGPPQGDTYERERAETGEGHGDGARCGHGRAGAQRDLESGEKQKPARLEGAKLLVSRPPHRQREGEREADERRRFGPKESDEYPEQRKRGEPEIGGEKRAHDRVS